jgi:hypothetical protein
MVESHPHDGRTTPSSDHRPVKIRCTRNHQRAPQNGVKDIKTVLGAAPPGARARRVHPETAQGFSPARETCPEGHLRTCGKLRETCRPSPPSASGRRPCASVRPPGPSPRAAPPFRPPPSSTSSGRSSAAPQQQPPGGRRRRRQAPRPRRPDGPQDPQPHDLAAHRARPRQRLRVHVARGQLSARARRPRPAVIAGDTTTAAAAPSARSPTRAPTRAPATPCASSRACTTRSTRPPR